MNVNLSNRATRDEQIVAMWNDGATTGAVGIAFGISDSAVAGILHRARAHGVRVITRGGSGRRCRTPEQDIAHAKFMVSWWSGEVLATVHDPAKAEAARQALAGLS